MRLFLKVLTKRSETKVIGLNCQGRWEISLREAPHEGQANQALLAFLSEWLGIPKKGMKLISGEASSYKCLLILEPYVAKTVEKFKERDPIHRPKLDAPQNLA